ncbi:MAG: hypothetical protein QGH45_02365, partial [Myxococcota bacterium]|nr:hypothetical protein [Myxococcota bacterium]
MADPAPWSVWLVGAARAAAIHLRDRIERVIARRRHVAGPLALLCLLTLAIPLFGLGSHLTRRTVAEPPRRPTAVPQVAVAAGAEDEAGLFNEPVDSQYVEHVEVPPPGQLDGSMPVPSETAEADVFAGARTDRAGSNPAETLAYLTWVAMVLALVLTAQLRLAVRRR